MKEKTKIIVMEFNKDMSPDEGVKWAASKIVGEKYQTPDKFPYPKSKRWNISSMMNEIQERYEWNKKGMFAFISKEWIKPFSKWIGKRACLEVMAGAGHLSKALREFGINVIATDDYSWPKKNDWEFVTEVIEMEAVKAVIKYGKQSDIIIMSWPYMDSTAFKVLQAMHVINPHAILIYIGEWHGGCTADDEFFRHFSEIDDMEFTKAVSNFRSWEAIHDYVYQGKWKD
jgi:hypothetical protein